MKKFVSFVAYIKWKLILKRRGATPGNVVPIFRNKIRHSANFYTIIKMNVMEQRAIKMLKTFFMDNKINENMRIKFREFNKNIDLVHKRIRGRIQSKKAKLEVLIKYWNKIYVKT